MAAQERYYEDRIKSNPNWQFAGIYSDVGRKKCYGYKHDKAGHLVIDEAKAGVVRIIFRMADEGASLAQIAQILQEQSIPTPRGKAVWSRETLRKILHNEKYFGTVILQKTFVADCLRHKQIKNVGQRNQFEIVDNHTAIIVSDEPRRTLSRCSYLDHERNPVKERGQAMHAYTYVGPGRFELIEKQKPVLQDRRDAIVRVTLASICTSDLHIKHGSVPRAVPGITVGHEMVGIVETIGGGVSTVQPGDRVVINVETFCGDCFFCRHGWVNNCIDPNGGWALGCRIDGGQAEYVRVPYADQGLTKIPDSVTDQQALFVGDILATGYWAADIAEISEGDTVLIIGAGPTGICTLQCVLLKQPKQVIVCEKDPQRRAFVQAHYPQVLTVGPDEALPFVHAHSDHGGADAVLEVAGSEETFQLAWQCARPNAVVTVVALYDTPQILPLPEMYGKNLTIKTGGVDGCQCAWILKLIEQGKIDTTPLITHTYPLEKIAEAYELFEQRQDGVIKVAVKVSTINH